MNNKKCHFAPWPYFERKELYAVQKVLRSGKVNQWTGNEVYNFEGEYADYLGVKYAVALMNGSVALDVALLVLGIGPGDEVIVPSRTFLTTASCIVLKGAIPMFADVDPDSGNVSLDSVKKVCTSKTKAVIAVHLAGWPCQLDRLRDFCNLKGIYLVEDCAQAHGAKYKGRPVGSFGDVACFSFCEDKIITTGGEGGLLVTNNRDIWKTVWSFKDYGRDYDTVFNKKHSFGFRWLVKSAGTNYRMTEMQATIGRVMLSRLDGWVKKRRKLAEILSTGFEKLFALRVTHPNEDYYHSYYKYYVYVQPARLRQGWSRDRILQVLQGKGIPCSIGVCPEVYLEGLFKKLRRRKEERLPVAKQLGETSMMFLVHPTLNEDNMYYILAEMQKILKKATK